MTKHRTLVRHLTGMRARFNVVLFLLVAVIAVSGAQGPAAVDALGPQVGSRVPAFTATDQSGRGHTLQSLLGPKGAMLVFSRSADW